MESSIQLEKVKDLNLLCNYENGSVVFIDDEYINKVIDYINDSNISHLPVDMQKYLFENGFFTTENDKFIQAYIHVTDRCNMDCIGCYSKSEMRNRIPDLSYEQIEAILNELRVYGVNRIIISGGEPMLRKDIVHILKYGKNCGFEIIMITNGSIIVSEEIFDFVDVISFSIDYLDVEYNTLQRRINKEAVLENIKRAKNHGVAITGIITINSKNISDIENYFTMSREYQIPISFSIFYSGEKECSQLIIKDDQLRYFIMKCKSGVEYLIEGFTAFDEIFCRNQCAVGKHSISVDASGNLTPCHMLGHIHLGNLLYDAEQAWNNLNAFNTSLKISEQCTQCDYKVLCGGGCKARSILSGGLDSKDPYCEMYRSYYEKQYEYMKQILAT